LLERVDKNDFFIFMCVVFINKNHKGHIKVCGIIHEVTFYEFLSKTVLENVVFGIFCYQ